MSGSSPNFLLVWRLGVSFQKINLLFFFIISKKIIVRYTKNGYNTCFATNGMLGC